MSETKLVEFSTKFLIYKILFQSTADHLRMTLTHNFVYIFHLDLDVLKIYTCMLAKMKFLGQSWKI